MHNLLHSSTIGISLAVLSISTTMHVNMDISAPALDLIRLVPSGLGPKLVDI
jgi:hypothetical protein